jgi:hypothetical protein
MSFIAAIKRKQFGLSRQMITQLENATSLPSINQYANDVLQ